MKIEKVAQEPNRRGLFSTSIETALNHRSAEVIELINHWKQKAIEMGYSDVELDVDYDVLNFWAVK